MSYREAYKQGFIKAFLQGVEAKGITVVDRDYQLIGESAYASYAHGFKHGLGVGLLFAVLGAVLVRMI